MHPKIIPALVATAFLCGCGSDMGQKQGVGALGGAVAGGLAGSAFGSGKGKLIATGIGAVLGAFTGSEMGKSLDRADQLYATQAASMAFSEQPGQPFRWMNPQSGNYGQIVTMAVPAKPQCREFTQTIYVGGKAQKAYGQACRQQDGSWEIANG